MIGTVTHLGTMSAIASPIAGTSSADIPRRLRLKLPGAEDWKNAVERKVLKQKQERKGE